MSNAIPTGNTPLQNSGSFDVTSWPFLVSNLSPVHIRRMPSSFSLASQTSFLDGKKSTLLSKTLSAHDDTPRVGIEAKLVVSNTSTRSRVRWSIDRMLSLSFSFMRATIWEGRRKYRMFVSRTMQCVQSDCENGSPEWNVVRAVISWLNTATNTHTVFIGQYKSVFKKHYYRMSITIQCCNCIINCYTPTPHDGITINKQIDSFVRLANSVNITSQQQAIDVMQNGHNLRNVLCDVTALQTVDTHRKNECKALIASINTFAQKIGQGMLSTPPPVLRHLQLLPEERLYILAIEILDTTYHTDPFQKDSYPSHAIWISSNFKNPKIQEHVQCLNDTLIGLAGLLDQSIKSAFREHRPLSPCGLKLQRQLNTIYNSKDKSNEYNEGSLMRYIGTLCNHDYDTKKHA